MLTAQPTLPVEAIVVHERRDRRELGDLSDLTETIPTVGILEPLVVAPIPGTTTGACPRCGNRVPLSDKGFVPAHSHGDNPRCPGSSRHPKDVYADHALIAGRRRLEAAKACGLARVPVVIREDLDTEAKRVTVMAIENISRKNLSAVEEAATFQLLMDFGDYTPARIAAETGVPRRTVQMRLGLNRLPEQLLDRTHSGQISIGDAEILASFARDQAALAELEPLLGTSNFRLRVQMLRDRAEHQRKAAQMRRQLEAEGVRVIDTPDGYPWSSTETRVIDIPDLDEAQHETCPGHAVIIVSNSSGTRQEAVCVDPEKHGHLAKADAYTRGELDAQDDDPAVHQPTPIPTSPKAAELAAAETLRNDFAAEIIQYAAFGPVLLRLLQGVAQVLLDELDEYEDIAPLAKLLNLPDDFGNEQIRTAVDQKIATARNVDAIAALLFAIAHVGYTPANHSMWNPREISWVTTLTALGYQLSDVERDELKVSRPVETVAATGDVL